MFIKYILLIYDVNQFIKRHVHLFLMYLLETPNDSRFSPHFIVQSNNSCGIFIYAVFPHILISLNTFILNSDIIWNILHISHDLHNDSKVFPFCFLMFHEIFIREGIQNKSFIGLVMQFPLLVYMERRVWYAVSLTNEYENRKSTLLLLFIYLFS